MRGAAALSLLLVIGASCDVRSYPIFPPATDAGGDDAQPRPDGAFVDMRVIDPLPDGAPPPDGGRPDGALCVPMPETCNGADDDCDGQSDEGFDFFTDGKNCGRCGNVCAFGNADAVCTAGKCVLATCRPGFVDTDKVAQNGCECAIGNQGVEACNGLDDDCDGLRDEDFDLGTDVRNCGLCGQVCQYANAAATCGQGRCAMGACTAGFVDLDRGAPNGCEYACAPSNDGTEICDGKDNDCNGKTDESDPRAGTPCYPSGTEGCDAATGTCRGGCALGRFTCLPGGLVCENARLPEPDLCDGGDNDCDGAIDEDFDLQNDPRWCGACGHVCKLPEAISGCAMGACTVALCRAGFVDLDRGPDNGCEYRCTRDGPELCDGRDNDCDGATDDADSDLRFPPENPCSQIGECGNGPGGSARYPGAASYPVCVIAPGGTVPDWYCNYPATVELFAPNQILGQETRCDGKDNDCDGTSDEHASPAVGSACTDQGLGQCRKAGVLRCQADPLLAPACDVSAAPEHQIVDEQCDGKDSDCDGLTDEPWDNPTPSASGLPPLCAGGQPCKGVRDDVARVTVTGADFFIYRFEASRPDATASDPGSQDGRACSTAAAGGALPWTSVNHARAATACAAAGMRLCRTIRAAACSSTAIASDEWGLACTAGVTCANQTPQAFPYGCGYSASACNGADAGLSAPQAGRAMASCVSPDLDPASGAADTVFHLSGNVGEWTEDCRGVLDDGSNRKTYTLRGGSHLGIAGALRCDFLAAVVAEDFAFTDTGFRCCSSCPAPLADCGSCVDLGSNNTHCGACGHPCAGGTSCDNGVCR